MSVRIGIGFSGWPFLRLKPDYLSEYVERAEALGVDSIWLSDRIVSPVLNMESIVALSFISARTKKIKFGTSVLALPLRNPTVLAKQIATLDFLSGGRVLPAFGLGTENLEEFEACESSYFDRAGRMDEAIQIIRLLWSQDNLTYRGRYVTLNNVTIEPKPVQESLPPIWIGGRSQPALRRVARIGDGWLVSQALPDEISCGISYINEQAAIYGRAIDSDHFGSLFSFCIADTRKEAEKIASPFLIQRRADIAITDWAACGTPDRVCDLIDKLKEAGITKFVARPACPPELMTQQLELFGRHVLPRYHDNLVGDGAR